MRTHLLLSISQTENEDSIDGYNPASLSPNSGEMTHEITRFHHHFVVFLWFLKQPFWNSLSANSAHKTVHI